MELNESIHSRTSTRGQETQFFKTNRSSILQNFIENGKAEVFCKSCGYSFRPNNLRADYCDQCHTWVSIYRNVQKNKALLSKDFSQGVSNVKR